MQGLHPLPEGIALEGKLPGPSRALPTAFGFSQLEIDPASQRASICVSDRRDFYHQFQVTPQRALTNALWPCLRADDIKDLQAYKAFLAKPEVERYDRSKHGDAFGGDVQKKLPSVKDGLCSKLVSPAFPREII